MVKMAERYMLREQVSKEDREFMQRLYRRAMKPKEQLKIICELFPNYSKEQIMRTLGLKREKKAPEKKKEYNEVKRVIRTFDEETKAAAVKAVLVDGERNTDVAERYGVSTGTLGGWLKKARDQQKDYMQYADKVEKELTGEKDAAPEDKEIDWQRLKPRPEPVFERVEETQETELAEPVYEYVSEDAGCGSGAGNPSPTRMLDTDKIKAAAFDVITNQMNEYPCSSTDTMMRFIQGVQALANQLCEVE